MPHFLKKIALSAVASSVLSAASVQATEPTDIETDQSCQRFSKIAPLAEFGDKVKMPNLVLKIEAGASRKNNCLIKYYQKKPGSNDLGFPEFAIIVAQYRSAPDGYAEGKAFLSQMSQAMETLSDKQVSGIREGYYHFATQQHNVTVVTSKNDYVTGYIHKAADKKILSEIFNTVVPRLNSAEFDKYRTR